MHRKLAHCAYALFFAGIGGEEHLRADSDAHAEIERRERGGKTKREMEFVMRNLPPSKVRSFSFHVHVPLLEESRADGGENNAHQAGGGNGCSDITVEEKDSGMVASQMGAPCCAAASVATALNFLEDESGERHTAKQILDVYEHALSDTIARTRRRIANLLELNSTSSSSDSEKDGVGEMMMNGTEAVRKLEEAIIDDVKRNMDIPRAVSGNGDKNGCTKDITLARDTTPDAETAGGGDGGNTRAGDRTSTQQRTWRDALRKKGRKALVLNALKRVCADENAPEAATRLAAMLSSAEKAAPRTNIAEPERALTEKIVTSTVSTSSAQSSRQLQSQRRHGGMSVQVFEASRAATAGIAFEISAIDAGTMGSDNADGDAICTMTKTRVTKRSKPKVAKRLEQRRQEQGEADGTMKLSSSSLKDHVVDSDSTSVTDTRTETPDVDVGIELVNHMRRVAGLSKLCDTNKPSTAAIGNASVCRAVDAVNRQSSEGAYRVSAKLVTARKRWTATNAQNGAKGNGSSGGGRIDRVICIHRLHSSAQRRLEWNTLCALFAEPRSILIYHLKNHYCCIYAVREFWYTTRDDTGVVVDVHSTVSNSVTTQQHGVGTRGDGTAADIDDDDDEEEDDDLEDNGGDEYGRVATASSTTLGSERPEHDTHAGRHESHNGEVVHVREVFTSRKGQHPRRAEWISYDEVREAILSWAGYGIIQVKRERISGTSSCDEGMNESGL